jgi:hypothetical protein
MVFFSQNVMPIMFFSKNVLPIMFFPEYAANHVFPT